MLNNQLEKPSYMYYTNTYMAEIFNCFFGGCWYFPAREDVGCSCLMRFAHFSSAIATESAISLSSSLLRSF